MRSFFSCVSFLLIITSSKRYPSFSIAGIDTPSSGNPTIIPRMASASVSIRTVPDQNHEDLCAALTAYVGQVFSNLKSRNTCSVEFRAQGQWWLGDLNDDCFTWTSDAIQSVWKQKPLFTREGGTIPILTKLEQKLGCKSMLLPLGQAGDNAHLANERISISNLLKGSEVFARLFSTSIKQQEGSNNNNNNNNAATK